MDNNICGLGFTNLLVTGIHGIIWSLKLDSLLAICRLNKCIIYETQYNLMLIKLKVKGNNFRLLI